MRYMKKPCDPSECEVTWCSRTDTCICTKCGVKLCTIHQSPAVTVEVRDNISKQLGHPCSEWASANWPKSGIELE